MVALDLLGRHRLGLSTTTETALGKRHQYNCLVTGSVEWRFLVNSRLGRQVMLRVLLNKMPEFLHLFVLVMMGQTPGREVIFSNADESQLVPLRLASA